MITIQEESRNPKNNIRQQQHPCHGALQSETNKTNKTNKELARYCPLSTYGETGEGGRNITRAVHPWPPCLVRDCIACRHVLVLGFDRSSVMTTKQATAASHKTHRETGGESSLTAWASRKGEPRQTAVSPGRV